MSLETRHHDAIRAVSLLCLLHFLYGFFLLFVLLVIFGLEIAQQSLFVWTNHIPGLVRILIGLLISVGNIASANWLQTPIYRRFSVGIGMVNCLCPPIGTVLGIATIYHLMKPGAIAL